MKVIRPITKDDLPVLEKFAQTAGMGVTSLPRHPTRLEEKLERSIDSFKQGDEFDSGLYLFVLEDLSTGQLGGTCAVDARTRGSQNGYYYRVEELILPKDSPSHPQEELYHRNWGLVSTAQIPFGRTGTSALAEPFSLSRRISATLLIKSHR